MSSFYEEVLLWYDSNKRSLPWREQKTAYHVWLSEIILQQTRVDQGLGYYLKFTSAYPTVFDLAKASEDEVLKLWEGLGYYSRGRNLLHTAQVIVKDYNGEFPSSAKELVKLKGIGPYTSAAISSIVNKENVAAVDGNAFRVLSRYFDIDKDISQPTTRKYFEALMTQLIEGDRPGDFNQAVMDMGASICTPKKYNCDACMLSSSCLAFHNRVIDQRPVKKKKIKVTDRFLNFLILERNGIFAIEKRTQGIWKGLYQFPMIETRKQIDNPKQLIEISEFPLEKVVKINSLTKPHKLSHQNLFITYWKVEGKDLKTNYSSDEIRNLSFPKPLKVFIEEELLEVNI